MTRAERAPARRRRRASPRAAAIRTRARAAADEVQRRLIAECVCRVIDAEGLEGTTLRRIAAELGCTTGLIAHYFPSKEALLVEVLRLRDQLDLGRMGALSLDQLRQLVGYNATRPGIVQSFTVLSGESVTENHPARDYFVDRYDRLRRDLASSVQAEKLPPELLATLVIAVMDGLQLQWLLQPDRVDMPEAFEAFVRLLTD